MTKQPKPPIKMEELAKLANVSVSTVSRALAGSSLINENTRKRIEELALKHNFQINEKARNFRLKRTNMVAVVAMLDAKSGQHISDMFFLEMIGAIADALAAHGYDLLLHKEPLEDVREVRKSRIFSQSDGIIFIGQRDQHDNLNEFATYGKPVVVWGAEMENRKYCLVGSNNELGGYLAAKHLLNLGRKRLAFFGDLGLPEPVYRFNGFLRALKEKNVPFDKKLHCNSPFDVAHASEAVRDFLQHNPDFDGVVCASDLIAISSISAITEIGRRVPEDVAIVGFDDIILAAYSSPSLTTVRQNIAQGGRIIAQKMMAQINGDKVGDATLNTELLVRRSSGAW